MKLVDGEVVAIYPGDPRWSDEEALLERVVSRQGMMPSCGEMHFIHTVLLHQLRELKELRARVAKLEHREDYP